MAVPVHVSCQNGRKDFLGVVQGKQDNLTIFQGNFFGVCCEEQLGLNVNVLLA